MVCKHPIRWIKQYKREKYKITAKGSNHGWDYRYTCRCRCHQKLGMIPKEWYYETPYI